VTELKAGLRLKSGVCDGEAMVVKGGAVDSITCGGVEMSADGSTSGTANDEHMHGCQVGKRYVNEDESVELLCVKAGTGSFAVNGDLLLLKETKKLPSSD
jgi:hypothetical protein